MISASCAEGDIVSWDTTAADPSDHLYLRRRARTARIVSAHSVSPRWRGTTRRTAVSYAQSQDFSRSSKSGTVGPQVA